MTAAETEVAVVPPRSDTLHLAVGRIVRAHGLKGEVLVEPLTPHGDRFAAGAALWLAESADGGEARPTTITASRVHKQRPLISLAGVADRSAAEELVGRWLLVPYADAAAARAEDEFFLHALIGRAVRTEDGADLGHVMEIVETRGQALLEIGAPGRPRRLLPFVRAFVRDVQDDAIIVAPPDGWDDDLPAERGA